MVLDIEVPRVSNIRKKEFEKLEKCQGLKEELKNKVVPVVVGVLRVVSTPEDPRNNIRTLCPEKCSAANS